MANLAMLLLQTSATSRPIPSAMSLPSSSSYAPAHNQTCLVPLDYYAGQPAWHPIPSSPYPAVLSPSPAATITPQPDICAVPGQLRCLQTCYKQTPTSPMPHTIPANTSSQHHEVSQVLVQCMYCHIFIWWDPDSAASAIYKNLGKPVAACKPAC